MTDARVGASVLTTLATIYQQLGEPARAATLLRDALHRLPAPASPEAALERAALHEELASAELGISDFDGAGQAFTAAAELRRQWAPDDIEGRFRSLRNRGWLAYRRGLNDQALPDLEAALLLAQQHPELMDQRIEDTLGRSMARSDEQLAYYVAQAREVIDLSISSQQGVLEDLRRLHGRPAAAARKAVDEVAG